MTFMNPAKTREEGVETFFDQTNGADKALPA
jgi:hypothetical protein